MTDVLTDPTPRFSVGSLAKVGGWVAFVVMAYAHLIDVTAETKAAVAALQAAHNDRIEAQDARIAVQEKRLAEAERQADAIEGKLDALAKVICLENDRRAVMCQRVGLLQ
jgi:hypothetical protein